MAGISSVLNIAKEALLTHQASISVSGHNIANVDTPGYSRQILGLSTVVSAPSGIGFFGSGVTGTTVERQYDQFMVKRLTDQNSHIKNLEAMQNSMRVVETIFNEAPGLAINDLLSQFWETWQGLSNNPEISSSRQSVIQQAELLNSQFSMMSSEVIDTRNDIAVSLQAAVDTLNSLTEQIANLNIQITSSESSLHKQNDLRDKRDTLLKEISSQVTINYFEISSGAYTVTLPDGSTLVEGNESSKFDWSDNQLSKINTNPNGTVTKSKLNETTPIGGVIGGLVEINRQLLNRDPDNYLGRLNSLVNSVIREVNQQHSQGVGTVKFSEILTSAELAQDVVLLQSSVDSDKSLDTISAGTFTINDRQVGKIEGGLLQYGLAMAKTYNAAQAINNSYAGVDAKLTTQVAGNAVSGGTLGGLDSGESVTFSINGIEVTYAAGANESEAATATNVAAAINTAISTYNTLGVNTPKITIRATVGNSLNGGNLNSIILQNTNNGDESQIIIAGVDDTPVENKLGITNGTYVADSTHNTGQLSLFTNNGPISIDGGGDDRYLSQLGWASAITYSDQAVPVPGAAVNVDFILNGSLISATTVNGDANATITNILTAINNKSKDTGVVAVEGDGTNDGVPGSIVFTSSSRNIIASGINAAEATALGFTDFTKLSVAGADTAPGDGKLSFGFSDNGVANSIMGFDYANDLITDGGSFNIWIYDNNGKPALPQPVNVSLDRVYNLNDVAAAINVSIENAINDPAITPWIAAQVSDNRLVLTPDKNHQFAFGGDTSNFLATAGLNTFFSGHSADTIAINTAILDDMNNLAAGTINQYGEIFSGDNSNSLEITSIQRKEAVSFYGGTIDTLDGHYNSLVAEIGLKTRSINTDLEFNIQVNGQLEQMRDATSGVSLDEEMANLIKFQHAYSAAAKLITASDEMLTTLLNSV